MDFNVAVVINKVESGDARSRRSSPRVSRLIFTKAGYDALSLAVLALSPTFEIAAAISFLLFPSFLTPCFAISGSERKNFGRAWADGSAASWLTSGA